MRVRAEVQVKRDGKSVLYELEGLLSYLLEMNDRLNERVRELEELDSARKIRRLEEELERSRAWQERVDPQLTRLLGDYVARNPQEGRLSEQDAAHHDLGVRYTALVQHLTSSLVYRAGVGAEGPLAVARLTRELCDVLFGADEPHRERIARILPEAHRSELTADVDDVVRQVRLLRDDVRTAGRKQRWDFEPLSEILNEEIQEQLPSPQPASQLIDFVVAPAYIVDDATVVVRQKVVTRPQRASSAGGSDSGGTQPSEHGIVGQPKNLGGSDRSAPESRHSHDYLATTEYERPGSRSTPDNSVDQNRGQ